MYEMNAVPVCGPAAATPAPVQQPTTTTTTTFLTTHLPLAVQSLTKTTKHGTATVSRKVFGPNNCITMTTWLEKFTYSTVKSETVGKPVVSDSVVIPQDVLRVVLCPQGSPLPENQGAPAYSSPSECPPSSTPTSSQTPSSSYDNPSELENGAPASSSPSECPPSSTPTSSQTPCSSYDNPSELENVLVEMAEESEDEIRTDSEDEERLCTDSEDEERLCQ